ncbi:MAG: MOSC domain-containing protein [Pseudonocardia sp.]|nr:MOSC domain-containing protein [Pseudonocardia sp.]
MSVAVAVVRTDPWTRTKSGRSGIDKRPVDGPVRLTESGVDGDTICDVAHHGGPDQAVYAYSTDDLAWWSAELRRTVVSVGQNLTVSGVDCSGSVIGERWQVGEAGLVVRGPRIPCRVFAGFLDVPDLVKRFTAARRPGCYLAVERAGEVRAGDAVTVLARPAHGVTVTDLMAAMTGDRSSLPRLRRAEPDLGVRGREWLAGVSRAS